MNQHRTVEWKAQRLALVKYRNLLNTEIRCLDEMIAKFGEGERGTKRP